MTTVASLAVEVLARTENFARGMDKVIDAAEQADGIIASALNHAAACAEFFAQKMAMAADSTMGFVETAQRAGVAVSELTGLFAALYTKLPIGHEVASVLQFVAGGMQLVVAAVLAFGVAATVMVAYSQRLLIWSALTCGSWDGMLLRLHLLKVAWTNVFSMQAAKAVIPTLTAIGVKLLWLSGIAGAALFLSMAASVESADRAILGLIGETTVLQDALAKLGDAWRLLSEFMAGDFFTIVGTGLGAVATVLIEIMETVHYLNDISGGWLKTILSLIGVSMTLYAAWKGVVMLSGLFMTLWKGFAGISIIKGLIAVLKTLGHGIWLVATAQLNLNWLSLTYLKQQAGLALVAVKQGICVAATWLWVAAQTALNTATTYWLGLTVVGLAAAYTASQAAAAYTASQASAAQQAATTTAQWTDANTKLAESLENAGRKSTSMLERLKELEDFAKQKNFDALDITQRDAIQKQKIAEAANPVPIAAATVAAIQKDEINPINEAIEQKREAIKDAGNKQLANQLADEIKKLEERLQDAEKRQDEALAIMKNAVPLSKAGQALAHRERMEANIRELGITLIRSANTEYVQTLRNLDKALSAGWISFREYNRQLEAAAKTLQQNDPEIRARLDAEKRLADAMDQAAKSIIDSLKTPWMSFDEKARQIDELLQNGNLDGYQAADAHTANVESLKSSLGFADIKTPSEMLADSLYDLARLTKEVGVSETQMRRHMDNMADSIASASGISDLFDALPEQQIAKLATMLDGIDSLVAMNAMTSEQAEKMRHDAAAKFVTDKAEPKNPTYVVRGTTEAYQRDQEVLREANGSDKKLEELQKLLAEAELARREQEESRRTQEQIAENTAVLKNLKQGKV